MWRWSWFRLLDLAVDSVFSTYVEVILLHDFYKSIHLSILHVCGGDPILLLELICCLLYSPRMWRWSYSWRKWKTETISILHVCGGDPSMLLSGCKNIEYSPRMWRWSPSWKITISKILVFSTYVEVIPGCMMSFSSTSCILHVCGGDPFTAY